METLKQHNEPFKMGLTNRFHQLSTEDIIEWNKQIINTTKECAVKAAGKQKKTEKSRPAIRNKKSYGPKT